jgi:hypothetical protein
MKNTSRLLFATLLAVSSLTSAVAATSTATVTRVEDRKVLNMRAFGRPEDAVSALMASTEHSVRVGTAVPMNVIYIVKAKTADGKRVELTAQSAPEVGSVVSFDTESKQVLR